MNTDDRFVSRTDDAINRAAISATVAIENCVGRNLKWSLPMEIEDRDRIEDFVREVLRERLGGGPR